MADFQSIKLTKPNVSGPLQQQFVDAVHQSDAAQVTHVNITSNLLTVTAANTFAPGNRVSFTGLTAASFLNGQFVVVENASGAQFTAAYSHANHDAPETDGFVGSMAGDVIVLGPGGRLDPSMGGGSSGASSFDQLVGGTNNSGNTFVVGSTSVMTFSGTGVVNANKIIGLTVAGGAPTHEGQLLISQPGNTSVAFADPLVQGLYPEGASVASPPAFAAPTTIQPVFIAGKGLDGNLHGLKVANDGSLTVTGAAGTEYVEGTVQPTPTGVVAMGKDASNVLKSLKLDGSGNLDVNIQSTITATGDGSLLPSVTTWIGASDGTNLRGLVLESASNKNLRVAIYNGSTEATVTATGALKVDGSAVVQPVSIAATLSQNLTQVAGVAVSLGQKTMANSFPVVLASDQSRLNTQDAAEANANGSTAVPTNALYVGAKGADGFLHALSSSTNDGKLDVNASFSGSVSTDFIVDRTQSGAITSNQTVVVNTKGAASVVFNITGTWSGTIVFEALMPDTTTWVLATCYAKFPSGAGVTQATGNGQWIVPVGGINQFRVRGNTVSSGTATANLEAGAGGLAFEIFQPTAANLNATVTGSVSISSGSVSISSGSVTAIQGSANTLTNGWPVKITDGTSVLGTSANPLVSQDKADGAPNTVSQPSQAMQMAGWDGTHLRAISTDASGFLNVNASVSGTFTPALTSDRTATGTINGNGQNVSISSQGTGTVLFNISGTWNGTLQFEASVDGTNWVAVKCLQRFPTGVLASSLIQNSSAVTNWSLATGGVNSFRVRSSAWTSGTITIWLEGGAGAQDIQTLSLITDATNVAAVKAASTNPVAADPALVVSLSPNSDQFATSTTANALPGVNPVTVGLVGSVTLLGANAARKEIIVVNTGTTILYLGLGQTPTSTSYHIALAKCSVANDGTGGSWISDMWKGAVNAIGSNTGGSAVVTELT